jgi:hypothetical protein
MEKETFKDIAGFEKLYQVSDKGTVRSLTFRNNQTAIERIRTLTPFDNGKGYLVVGLSKNGKRKNFYIHRLVASAFLPYKKGKKVVNHKDHDTYNNKVDNLEWCTQKENVRYSADRMRHEKARCKPSSTGEKYITKYRNSFRVNIRRKGICKQFKTLEEAKEFKKGVDI